MDVDRLSGGINNRKSAAMATAFIYDPRFLDHETGFHPETPRRLEVIRRALESDRGMWGRLKHVEPRPAADEDITRCHSSELIDLIREACERGDSMLDMDTIISRDSFDVARLAAGAGVTAVDQVVAGEVRYGVRRRSPAGTPCPPRQGDGILPVQQRGDRRPLRSGGPTTWSGS